MFLYRLKSTDEFTRRTINDITLFRDKDFESEERLFFIEIPVFQDILTVFDTNRNCYLKVGTEEIDVPEFKEVTKEEIVPQLIAEEPKNEVQSNITENEHNNEMVEEMEENTCQSNEIEREPIIEYELPEFACIANLIESDE